MILVADSGSTKADWIFKSPDGHKITFRTRGLNPFFSSEKDIVKILQQAPEIKPFQGMVSEIYFFGAGCSSPDKHEIVSNALSQVFTKAFISVENDLTGSAYATCGDSEGLCCIMGTGSNICFFDGSQVHSGKHGLGYILGDEGSGTYFGKRLLTSYLYGLMPDSLQKDFFKEYRADKESVIKNVYQKPFPNSYLASFARFMSDHYDHGFVQNILNEGFEEFFATNISSYSNYRQYACHFIGSIAFHFQDTLRQVCGKHGVKVGKILKHPIDDLYSFIVARELNNAY